MKKFCTKCGTAIDPKTGKCPVCEKEPFNPEENRANITPEQTGQNNNLSPMKKPDKKAAKKAAKKAKLANMSFGKKAKRFLLKVIAFILVVAILVTGIVGALVYFDILNIPFMLNTMNKVGLQTYNATHEKEVEKDLPETDESGFEYYNSPEENFVFEEGEHFVNNEMLVYLDSEAHKDKLESFLYSHGGKIVGELPEIARYQILFDSEKTYGELMEIIDELEDEYWVDSASLNHILEFDIDTADDEYYPDDALWKGTWEQIPNGGNWGMEAIDAPGAWHYRNKLYDVNIGIIDDMFYTNHPDLNYAEEPLGNKRAKNMVENKELEWSDHGTHTSGTAAAKFNNNKGVTGAAVNTYIYGASYKGMSNTSNFLETAFYYLIVSKKCSVINMSIGWNALTFNASRGNKYALNDLNKEKEEVTTFLKRLIDNGYQFVICKSSGNQNKVNDSYIYYLKDSYDDDKEFKYYSNDDYKKYKEGSLDGSDADKIKEYFDRHKNDLNNRSDSGNVDAKYDIFGAITDSKVKSRIIMVGAAKNLGTHKEGGFLFFGRKTVHSGYDIAEFSQCGSTVDVIAPGVNIQSTVKDGFYSGPTWSGTSMAAPHVTGVAGLIFAANPNIKGDMVRDIIRQSATGSYGSDNYGFLNAKNAVEMALDTDSSEEEYEDEDEEYDEDEDEDEDKPSKGGKNFRATSDERDIVLVLDVSGSMAGEPIEETRKASSKFINTILNEDASIGIVTYDDSASMLSDFSGNKTYLHDMVSSIGSGGSTNIESGLSMANSMLENSNAKKKIIVLMSDGEPNEGLVGDNLIKYAGNIKEEGIIIYTLGFFSNMGYEKSSAQILMEQIASEGCHYEVDDADHLQFFFGDIADQINGQKYIYIRIACPVDVKVSYDGEKLSSTDAGSNVRTSFGSLTFEEKNEDEDEETESSTDDRVKVLRLKEGPKYDIKISGNGKGKMNYTIGFMDEEGEYSDSRKFKNIKISKKTKIDTVAARASSTVLKVDSDGDGKYDVTYKAKANGIGKIVNYKYLWYIGIGTVTLIVLLIIYKKSKKRRKKAILNQQQSIAVQSDFCTNCGNRLSGSKKFCTKCGQKQNDI